MIDVGVGAEEDAVGASDFKAFEGAVFRVKACGVFEPEVHGTLVWVGEAKEWAGGRDVFVVGDVPCQEGEALAYGLLVGGVDVVLVADVDGDGHAGVGEREGFALGVAEFAPAFFGGAGEGGDLDEEKGEVALGPMLAPVLDHCGEEFVVEAGGIEGGVGFALVPDDALDRERSEGGDHGVVEGSGLPGVGVGMPVPVRSGGFTFSAELLVDGVQADLGSLVVGSFGAGCEDGHEGGVGAESVHAGPGFGGSAAPGGVDEADRDVQLLVSEGLLQIAREEVSDGGEVLCGGWSADGPASGGADIFAGIFGGVSFDQEEANVGEVGSGDLFVGVLDLGAGTKAGERHLHVGLARGKPEIAEEDVVIRNGVGALDGEGVGATGGLCGEVDAPAAGGASSGGVGEVVEGGSDGLAGCGVAPEMDGHVALEDHVAGEEFGERDFGLRGEGCSEKAEGEAKLHGGSPTTFIA